MANVEQPEVPVDQRVFTFTKGKSNGRKEMKWLLGGKGANLCEMARIGVNVPAGMTITTLVCQQYYENGGSLPEGLMGEIEAGIKEMEADYGALFGDLENPMLVSVRSGAAVSMPGMMDTVLNLGLNDDIIKGFIKKTDKRFAMDCYRRLLDMFGDVVLGIEHSLFEKEIHAIKKAKGVELDTDLTADDLEEVVAAYKGVYKAVGEEFPYKPIDQLKKAICAVFGSWNIPRAIKYREINQIKGLLGTAVNVQCMAYGNLNDDSGTGVCFTRNPATGEDMIYGEYLVNAQGEDVVAGIRTPINIKEMAKETPAIYKELVDNIKMLEKYMKDMQDTEFTVQDKRLYMLQTRNGKRTGQAAVNIACDLVKEGLLTDWEAVQKVEARHLDQLLHPQFEDPKAYAKDVFATGLAASPGAAIGRVVFTADDAEEWHERGEKVMLVREETSPEDVGGMHAAQGILTARGGMTSHAAVVARGWGKPCVCGCSAVMIDDKKKIAIIDDGKTHIELKEGDWISINGSSGEVIMGKQAVKAPELTGKLGQFMEWVDKYRTLEVHTNADTPEDALSARKNGAQGIGLTRTEHMFFCTPERIAAVRRMIAAEELASPDVKSALDELQAFQRSDFAGIFTAMDGLPVTVRLLDPPLHEFLPHAGPALDNLCKDLALQLKTSDWTQIKHKVEGLSEANPMMGFRGCRLGIVHPDITEMQARAIFQAAVDVAKKGVKVHPHIMVPLVGTEEELVSQLKVIRAAADEVIGTAGVTVDYKLGTMIEIPRGALHADRLAKHAEFFSFGTNDLTQMTFGYSRDDAATKFLPVYLKEGILKEDPFQTIDVEGVGELVKLAVQRGKSSRPDIELGICGEHGGDPESIDFFHKVGLQYVSCSPLRVPIARLAAAQAAIKYNPPNTA